MLRSKTVWKVFSVFLLILYLSAFLPMKTRIYAIAVSGDQEFSWEERIHDVASRGHGSTAGETNLNGVPHVLQSDAACIAPPLAAQNICRAPPESVV